MDSIKTFKRYLKNDELISKLKSEKLFQDKLLPDIKSGNVFPAIRNDVIDFYYYNSLLFEYDGEFKTHPKFAFVPEKYGKHYVTDGKKVGNVTDFYNGYKNIKERAKLYTSVEAIGVHYICKNGNLLLNKDYIALDIEVAFEKIKNEPEGTLNHFENAEEEKKLKDQNRIDVLLYSIKEKQLLFVEAKHYTNGEIWSNGTPKVVSQVKRYNDIIKMKNDEILKSYQKYIENLNNLFEDELEKPLPMPEKIYYECGLIIFGFDQNQKDNRLTSNKEKLISNDIRVYTIGNEKSIKSSTLYKEIIK